MSNKNDKIKDIISHCIGNSNRTNCYLSYFQVEEILQAGRSQLIVGENVVYLLVPNDNYNELIFFADDNALNMSENQDLLLKNLSSEKKCVINIVSKDESKYKEIVEALGFNLYKRYVRKAIKTKEDFLPIFEHKSYDFVDISEIMLIQNMMMETFDLISDKIPSKEELEKLIEQKCILKYSVDDKIRGFLIYEHQGIRSYLRMLCIQEDFRGQGIGKILLKRYFMLEANNTELFYLWVDSENLDAIGLYEKNGYISDGLKQYIYIR